MSRFGEAESLTVRLVVQQGPTKRAQDSATLRVRPDVSVVLADQAVLEGDGAAIRRKDRLSDTTPGSGM